MCDVLLEEILKMTGCILVGRASGCSIILTLNKVLKVGIKSVDRVGEWYKLLELGNVYIKKDCRGVSVVDETSVGLMKLWLLTDTLTNA